MSAVLPVPSRPAAARQAALDPLIERARRLMPIDAIAFLEVDAARTWLEPLADWYRVDELGAMVEVAQRRPYDRRRPGLPEIVLERDRPLLLPRLEDWEAAPMLLDRAREALGRAAAERMWSSYRGASLVCVPIPLRLRRRAGVLMAASVDPARRLRRPDLDLAELLAESAALLLERSWVADAEARRAREELMLKRAAEAVSASLEPQEVLDRIVDHALRVTGATKTLLTRLDPASNELVTAAQRGFSELVSEGRYGVRDSMIGSVARTRRPYLSRSEDRESWDRRIVESEQLGSFMHVPLELGPRLFGVLTAGHSETDRFGEEDLELLVKLARLSTAAIVNSTSFQHERRVAGVLTRGFVPQSLPDLPGFEVGLAYEPAAKTPVGGDVYGAWLRPSGEVAFLVGDVSGKGVETAALSSMARFFIEARAWELADPAEVLEQANTMLAGRLPPDCFVTAFLGFLSPGAIRFAGAGHLAPLHLTAAGEVAELRSQGLPLGVEARAGAQTGHADLAPGDVIFAFTDGLSEARRDREMLGTDGLRAILLRLAQDVGVSELPAAVHREVSDWAGGLADDAVGLALRRRAS
jgi:GAF domain-containing protein